MTALVVGTVEQTFSTVRRYLTGLSRLETHEPGRQNPGDFGDALGGAHQVGIEAVAHIDQVAAEPRFLPRRCWGLWG